MKLAVLLIRIWTKMVKEKSKKISSESARVIFPKIKTGRLSLYLYIFLIAEGTVYVCSFVFDILA
jgi:hypothetical protein